MRSLVLNTASVSGLSVDRGTLSTWLREIVNGMRRLVASRVARPELRMQQGIHRTRCLAEVSLFDVAMDLLRSGWRDEYEFFLTVAGRAEWTENLDVEDVDRFLACEEQTLPGRDGEPLMLCLITGGIAVGFPSSPLWDADRIEVRFQELVAEDEIEDRTETIEHLARLAHATRIAERHAVAVRGCADPRELWRRRSEAFPNLRFGPGVEADLARLGGHYSGVAAKLATLDAAAAEWEETGGNAPRWRTEVTAESTRIMHHPTLRDARRFKSSHGDSRIFEWHARYGSGFRIHLRFDRVNREIEIGYIGPHLRSKVGS